MVTYRVGAAAEFDSTAPPTTQSTIQSGWTIDGPLLRRAELWLATGIHGSAQFGSVYGVDASKSSMPQSRATMKYVCNGLHYDQMIRNVSLQDVEIVLYDCVLRSGVVPSFSTAATKASQVPDPLHDMEAGLTMQNHPSSSANILPVPGNFFRNAPGTTPFQSQVFCKLYKVRKVTKVTLSAGEVHHHHINVKPGKMFDGSVQDTYDSSQTIVSTSRGSIIPGLSGFTLITALGSVMNSKTDTLKIATSSVGLDVVTKTTGSFSSYTRERRHHMRFDGMALAVSDLQGVQDDDGEIVADTRA